MFITTPLNVDYLIEPVRIRIGDYGDTPRYSDALLRTSIIAGVRSLAQRWSNKYLVLNSGVIESIDDTYITVRTPAGNTGTITVADYNINDVYRNPDYPDSRAQPIAEEDETPIILATCVMLRQAILSSSMTGFTNWSDGEFSYSNVSSGKIQSDLLNTAIAELERYFKVRLAGAVRQDFPVQL